MTPKATTWNGHVTPVISAKHADDDGGKAEPQEVHAREHELQHEQHHAQDEPVPDPEAGEIGEKPLHVVRLPKRRPVSGPDQVCGTLPWRPPRAEGVGCPAAPLLLKASFVISARPASDPITAEDSSGIIRIFWFGDLAMASSAFT